LSGAEGLDIDIKISYPDTAFNIPQMTEIIKASTAARVDAIIVQGTNDAEYISALNAASEQGILIAFVDTDIEGFNPRLYVGTDNYAAGQLMAEKLIEIGNGMTYVAVLMGAEIFPNLISRLDGFCDSIEDNENIQLLMIKQTNFDALKTIEAYRNILEEEPAVNTIVCLDGSGASAFSSAIGPSDTSAVKILSFGISPETRMAIQNGIIYGTIIQAQTEMGEKTVQVLNKCFIGQQSLPEVIYTDIYFVTAVELEESVGES